MELNPQAAALFEQFQDPDGKSKAQFSLEAQKEHSLLFSEWLNGKKSTATVEFGGNNIFYNFETGQRSSV